MGGPTPVLRPIIERRAPCTARPTRFRHREQARTLAGGLDVRIGGGVQTIREFLQADLIDEMHLAMVPIILGRGERLWDGLEGIEERFNVESVSSPSGVTHLTFWRR